MATFKPAWIIHYKDISQEDSFAVYLTKTAALKRMADAVAGYAKSALESVEWEDGPPETLTDTLKAAEQGDHENAVAAWEEFSSEYGPMDETAILIESEVMD